MHQPYVFGYMVGVKHWEVCGSCGKDLPGEWREKRCKDMGQITPDEILDDNLYVDCDECDCA